MGSWGYNIYQDDIAMDLKDDYISFLKKCNTDEEAEQKIIEWKKDNICEDEESLFWYVLAFVQYKYGRLSEKVKERALYYIDHPEEDENLELYKEAGEKAYKKRKEVLLDLKEKLLGEPLPYKKVTKYKNVYSKFKVGACALYESGNTYCGCNVENASYGLSLCAERNAIFNMITNGEEEINKVLAVMGNGRTGAPCGACRELMVQLMPDTYKDIEIMLDFEKEKVVTLGELTPEWWI